MKVFICSVLIAFSFLAIVIVFTYLLFRFLLPKKHCDCFVCVPCNEETKDLCKIAYSMRLKLNLCGECENSILVLVDNGIKPEELNKTYKLCNETDGIVLVRQEDLKDFINGRF